jgi:HlyD family secretion protein
VKVKIIYGILLALFLNSCGKKTEETKPIRKTVTETIFASGVLEARNTYYLSAQADGYLIAVNFEEGDMVSEGKILAVVDNKESQFNNESADDLFKIAEANTSKSAPLLAQAQNSIEVSKEKMELDYNQYLRYKKLWENNSVAKIDYENSELQYNTSKKNYENSVENYKQIKQQADQQVISNKAAKKINQVVVGKNEIKAVNSGKIYEKFKQVGDFVKRGEAIALIGDANDIYALVNIDEANVGKVKIGQDATIELNTIKNKTYKGKVMAIYPSFNENTQSFTCKISFADSLDFRIVNTQLQSNIIVSTTENALLIPRNYLDFGGNVQIKGGKEKVKITTQFISNQWVQVLSGIDENTTLVTDNLSENNVATSEVGSQLNK